MPYGDSRGRVRAVTVNGTALPGQAGVEPAARRTCAARARSSSTSPTSRGRGTATRARAASASCGSRASGRPRRCARRPTSRTRCAGPTSPHNALTYILDRTTADVPVRAAAATPASAARASCATRSDPEAQLRRVDHAAGGARLHGRRLGDGRPAHAGLELDALAGTVRRRAARRLLGALRGPRAATARRARSTARRRATGSGSGSPGRPGVDRAGARARPTTVRTLSLADAGARACGARRRSR